MKKLVILIAIILLVTMSFTVYAEETDTSDISTIDITEEVVATDAITEEISIPVTEAPVPDVNEEAQPESLGKWLWDTAIDNGMTIFSGLALAASAVLLWLHKKKLFPFIKTAITAIVKAVQNNEISLDDWKKKLSERLEEIVKEYEEEKTALERELVDTRKDLKEALDKVDKIVLLVNKEAVLLLESVNAQEDTLNTIVQSSNMAQWKKDEVGAKHAAHVAAVSDMMAQITDESGDNV